MDGVQMRVTVSQFRRDVYRLLDRVLDTGEPLEVRVRGRTLRIVEGSPESWVDGLVVREGVLLGDPEEIVHLEWLPGGPRNTT